MKTFKRSVVLILIWAVQWSGLAQEITIKAKNDLSIGRMDETVELSDKQLKPLGNDINLKTVHIRDAAGRELLVQAIDTNADGKKDAVIFQVDFEPSQTRKFHVYQSKKWHYELNDFRAYGRFVQERFDDFAWENDRIAQRTYGYTLKTPEGQSLVSSAIDIWPKKTNKLIINEWYMKNHYHNNDGEGADLYSSGTSTGIGGDGLWMSEKLWSPENFDESKVIDNGPIRTLFRLKYNSFKLGQTKASETRTIYLDAGQNLNHYAINYDFENKPDDILAAAGIQKTDKSKEEIRKGLKPYHNKRPIERSPGKFINKDINEDEGWITTEQPVSEGRLYAAIIVDPDYFEKSVKDEKNLLMLTNLPDSKTFSYWAGYAWSRSGQFKDYDAWKKYVSNFAKRLQSPIKIEVLKE